MFDGCVFVRILMRHRANHGALAVIPVPCPHAHPFTGGRIASIGPDDKSRFDGLPLCNNVYIAAVR